MTINLRRLPADETVKTVPRVSMTWITGLKPGVNETLTLDATHSLRLDSNKRQVAIAFSGQFCQGIDDRR